MRKPKFTDEHKFPPGGYVPASMTEIAKTFKRARDRIAAQAARPQSVVPMKRAAK